MEHERGFHGWLVFFFLTASIGAAGRAYFVFRAAMDLRMVMAGDASFAIVTSVAAQTLIHLALFGGTIGGLWYFAQCRRATATYWASYLLASIVAVGALNLIGAYQAELIEGAPVSIQSSMHANDLRSFALQLVWVLYWVRSKRVLLTFGANAFQRGPQSPIADSSA
jgi:hypothetical protein